MRAIIPPSVRDDAAAAILPPAIAHGDLVFVTGMTGTDRDGGMPADPGPQFHSAFEKIAAPSGNDARSLGAIAEMTSDHVDIRGHVLTFGRVRQERLSAKYPAWTALEVAGLRRRDTVAQLYVIARKSAPR